MVLPPYGSAISLFRVGKDFGGPVNQIKTHLHIGPKFGGVGKPVVNDLLQFLQFARQPLFSSTDARLVETVVSRSCSLSPLA